jgi:hypothetical protein
LGQRRTSSAPIPGSSPGNTRYPFSGDLPPICRSALCAAPGEPREDRRFGAPRIDEPAAYHAEAILYLTLNTRFMVEILDPFHGCSLDGFGRL